MCSMISYLYNCPNCNVGYVGSTKRHLIKRIREHMGQSPRTGNPLSKPSFSAIRQYVQLMNSRPPAEVTGECSIAIEDFKILNTAKNLSDLHIFYSNRRNLTGPECESREPINICIIYTCNVVHVCNIINTCMTWHNMT